MSMTDVLVIGYGNPLRGDDGIGPAVAAEIDSFHFTGVRVLVVHQLTPELAADLVEVRLVVFVDAAVSAEPVKAVRLERPAPAAGVMTHATDPRATLALAWTVYGQGPEAWLVTAAGDDFGFHDGLSPIGRENTRRAREQVLGLIRGASDT